MEVYIDELVVKSKSRDDLIFDLTKTFNYLRQNKIMLNTKKHVFVVEAGKFLSFMVSYQGI